MVVGAEFVLSSEFRSLSMTYRDIKDLKWPATVVSLEGEAAAADTDTDAASDAEATGSENARVGARHAVPGEKQETGTLEQDENTQSVAPENAVPGRKQETKTKPKAPDVQVANLDELVEHFFAAGKRGVAINRYKGLGEMNPEQLWATTMDPEKRTLLQVRAEDHTEADLMFTTLMGDQVEPRRKFIEDNALDVKNLDI
jgi:DNA gyrase subunit B